MQGRRGVAAVVVRAMIALAVAAIALAACSPDEPPSTGTGTGSTIELAPSQITASTVAVPDMPPACDPAELSWWTAQVDVDPATSGSASTAVLRVRNDGAVRCEVDIAASAGSSAEMEPNVWLATGEWADVWVGTVGSSDCPASVHDRVHVAVNGADVAVPALVVGCDLVLLAFYVVEPASGPCARLASAVTDGAIVLRNESFESCELGSLIDADGVGIGHANDGSPIEVTELAGGDVVAVDLRMGDGEPCDDSVATLTFAAAGDVDVPGVGECASVVLGSGRPWFGAAGDPRHDLTPDDVEAALAGLAAFG